MDNIEAFIQSNINSEFNVKKLKKIIWGICGFSFIGIYISFLINQTTIIFGIIMSINIVISIIFNCFIDSKNSIENYVKTFCVITYCGVLNFLLITLCICQKLNINLFFNLIIFFSPFVLMALLFLLIKNRIKSQYYLRKKESRKKSRIVINSILGAVIGYNAAHIFFKNINQNTAGVIVIICFMFFSLMYSCGILFFMKLYYIKKFNLIKYKEPM